MVLSLLKEHKRTKVSDWLKIAELPRSSFYEWKNKLKSTIDKDKEIKEKILEISEKSKRRYGYRRVEQSLRNMGCKVNHKKVLRLMRELGVLCNKFRRKISKYNSFKGEIGKIADNRVKRNFKAEKPNQLWLTDVTEFKVNNEKLYLSAILDMYNSEIVSYELSMRPNLELTNNTLNKALKKRKNHNKLILHSDQGFQYQHRTWINKLDAFNIKQSMSRRGNCLDNSPMENFFGILKQEMYYYENFNSLKELKKEIEEYIKWYNEERIKTKLSGLSPIKYRLQYA
ncbi:MAG: IS3 family transposase [Peptoniphilaceae bacterium]|nr:IS3 family transposase [Peptoniphilaceae bacterium]